MRSKWGCRTAEQRLNECAKLVVNELQLQTQQVSSTVPGERDRYLKFAEMRYQIPATIESHSY